MVKAQIHMRAVLEAHGTLGIVEQRFHFFFRFAAEIPPVGAISAESGRRPQHASRGRHALVDLALRLRQVCGQALLTVGWCSQGRATRKNR